jgi:DNA-directed RNA polymerase subunit beta'
LSVSNDFDAIKIGLASPKQIRDWSSGEVTKPETLNYRSLKPEVSGLFCERIFGPVKDWECHCGKYKHVRYRGVICERCGVEVTRQKVRRERMGHIELAAPCSHIWYFKGVPSRIGYLLDIAPKQLERVLYFVSSIVTSVDSEQRAEDLPRLEIEVAKEGEQIERDLATELAAIAKRESRRVDYLTKGQERGFDEEDDFWTRGLSVWAEEQGQPELSELRGLFDGAFLALVPELLRADAKQERELVRLAALREERRLKPSELERVVLACAQVRGALQSLLDRAQAAHGAEKGALTKRLNQIIQLLTLGAELDGLAAEEQELLRPLDRRALERALKLGDGLLAELLQDPATDSLPERALELCLKPGGLPALEALQAWASKARELGMESEARLKDARSGAEEALRRLRASFELFRELTAKLIVEDDQLFRELKDRFGSAYGFGVYFTGGIGAEAVRDLLAGLDLNAEADVLREQIATLKGARRERALKRLKVVSAFLQSGNRPEWMILEALPVLPPELRPMVQLDGGRFATSDLNDLYRRVINRNNRLKRLLDLGAPEIIVFNEKRMLQEAVDALFDNGRRGRAVQGAANRPLKSLADMLKGKQGRFRQNLLGKRVDYSGRSVIVSGPHLKLHQCGLPKLMALELFKPLVMSRLAQGAAGNVKAARRLVDEQTAEVWDALEEVISGRAVLLNRAPTLHRLGIQAFEPILVEGKAIQVHPLVCHAFNADFDGDQMAVHLPLSDEAQAEARVLMLSSNNILSPANGQPLATPTQDMVLGVYYLTYQAVGKPDGTLRRLRSAAEAELLVEEGIVSLQQTIEFRHRGLLLETTVGRVLFNDTIEQALEESLGVAAAESFEFVNETLGKHELDGLIGLLIDRHGAPALAPLLDRVKELGFAQATRAGLTIGMQDIVVSPGKERLLADYELRVANAVGQYEQGLSTEEERRETVIGIWTEATEAVGEQMRVALEPENPLSMMVASGARGSFKQLRQLTGMRGLMANPKGEIIERPIRANFMEGLSVLEYFISTHGARKGLADTALRTADSGYLTRRLVDVTQNVTVSEEDCGTDEGLEFALYAQGEPNEGLSGRVLAADVHSLRKDGRAGTAVLARKGELLSSGRLAELREAFSTREVSPTFKVRSPFLCRSAAGVCQACYGASLASAALAEIGDAVGIIAAQSIGEPGTQLTMRTFHTGGVAGEDITQGLPRVVEIFEARRPKGAAALAGIAGTVRLEQGERELTLSIEPLDGEPGKAESHSLSRRSRLLVEDGQQVALGSSLQEGPVDPQELLALRGAAGVVPLALALVAEVQKVYRSQGVAIHDKHIELVVRQMLAKQRVLDSGETALLPSQLVEQRLLVEANAALGKGQRQATSEPLLLGITKAALATSSFLSAASFQETTKVLTDAAVEGKLDPLLGLKENVIIGRLIPAATGLRRYRQVQIKSGSPTTI